MMAKKRTTKDNTQSNGYKSNSLTKTNQRVTPDHNDIQIEMANNKPRGSEATNATLSEKQPVFKEILEACGFEFMEKAPNWILRISWLLFALGSISMLLINLVQNLNEYIENPLVTGSAVIPSESLRFPEVYLCPTNYINNSYVFNNDVDLTWTKYFRSAGELKLSPGVEKNNELLSIKQGLWDRLIVKGPLPSVLGTTPAPTPPDLQDYFMNLGYTAAGFLKECSFQGQPLDCLAITEEIFDRDRGKCFLIKTHRNQSSKGDGLSLLLDTHVNLYPPPEKDVKPPLFDGIYLGISHGFDPAVTGQLLVGAGTYSRVGLEVTRLKRVDGNIDGRYYQCHPDDQTKDYTILNMSYYTEESCYMDCTLHAIVLNCSCVLAVDRRFLQTKITEKLRRTRPNNEIFCLPEDIPACVSETIVNDGAAIRECMKKCYPPCVQWTYSKMISSLQFPSLYYKRLVPPGVEIRPIDGAGTGVGLERPEEHIILDITFDQLQHTLIIQRKPITVWTFVSNVGGQMGLWLGASIFAIIQILMLVIASLIKRKSGANE